jgi:hypothetical protein
MSSKTRPPPTNIQDIALNLVFAVMGEQRINRTQQEYAAIAAKLPPLKKLVFEINELLASIHKHAALSGVPLPQICRFQAGDKRWEFEAYPRQVSIETLRLALLHSGLRHARTKRHKSL